MHRAGAQKYRVSNRTSANQCPRVRVFVELELLWVGCESEWKFRQQVARSDASSKCCRCSAESYEPVNGPSDKPLFADQASPSAAVIARSLRHRPTQARSVHPAPNSEAPTGAAGSVPKRELARD